MHNSFMWLHTYPVCYLKLVKRCELELKQPAMQRVSSVQLVAPTHLLLSARKLYAYFCYFIPKNNYHYLVLSTGNIKP
nr:MAG TPA: hypothetical protein [Caudoviricetes sp.]